MSSLREGAIQCLRCKEPVPGYEHRVRFAFQDGERIQLGTYAALDCGCELLDYTVKVDDDTHPWKGKLIDTLRKDVILEFKDSGDHNFNWHADLFEGEEEW